MHPEQMENPKSPVPEWGKIQNPKFSDLEAVYRHLDTLFKITLGQPYPSDLTRLEKLLDRLGRPQAAFPAPIITGSKGKGSTATFLAALLQEQPEQKSKIENRLSSNGGKSKIGLFTGPHLHSYRERFQINGQPIAPEQFISLFEEVWGTIQGDSELREAGISRFEVITTMALLYFARTGVDMALLEVGMGGRFDAVNVAANSPLAVFTPIELEHVHALGPTLERIVYHKSGIMRPGGQAITAHQSAQAGPLLEQAAAEIGATLHPNTEFWRYQSDSLSLALSEGRLVQEFEATGPDGQSHHLRSGLAGTFQLENALTALGSAYLLNDWQMPNLAGLQKAMIPGRLEAVAYDPLVILDGAHTPNAMRELSRTLGQLPGQPVWVLGVLRDKLIGEMLAELPLEGHELILCEINSHRAASAELVQENLKQRPARLQTFGRDLAGAIEAARETARQLEGGYVCVTGSLYLVAESRRHFGLLDPITEVEAELLLQLEQELLK